MKQRTCEQCGKVFVGGPHNQRFCPPTERDRIEQAHKRQPQSECAREAERLKGLAKTRERQAERGSRPCPHCGVGMTHPRRVQCGAPECKRKWNAERTRKHQRDYRRRKGIKARNHSPFTCAECGKDCIPGQDGVGLNATMYCSKTCKGRAHYEPPPRRAPHCRVSDRPEPREWKCGACPECGKVETRRAFELGYCSYRCRRKEAKRRRRARLKAARVEVVDFYVVAKRDNWTCGICGDPITVERSEAYVAEAPTLDHIVSLAAGGEHSYANIQLAHWLCNSMKRDLSQSLVAA